VGAEAGLVDGFKLWYSGSTKARNGVGILVEEELVNFVVEVSRNSDCIMAIRVLVGSEIINVVSAYAPQAGLPEDIKKLFWEDLDIVIQGIPWSEKLFIAGDFNDHIGVGAKGYDTAHGGFDFGERNNG